jgi:pimeloyl-ACP methyl ester carboxylesterase
MSKDPIAAFLAASTRQRLQMVRDSRSKDALETYLGAHAYREYRLLSSTLDEGHLAVGRPRNLIFVPGVMGSTLESKTKGGIWWIDIRTRHHIDDLRLATDGHDDADPRNQIGPGTTDPSYESFLTGVLARDDFGHALFPYDWRKSVRLSADALRDLILKLHQENRHQPVHLVAHSMGGLTVRTALMTHPDELWRRVGRVVFIGTPHYGSPSIAGYLKNHLWGFELMAILGGYLSRDTYRSLWGVLSMLPAPRGIYPGTRSDDSQLWKSDNDDDPYIHPCANFDLYDATSWRLDLPPPQTEQLQRVLDGAAILHRDLYESHRAMDQEYRDRMLVIAGVGFQTLFRLAYRSGFSGVWRHTSKVKDRVPGNPHREGDGRVPLASTALENVQIRYVRGVHGGLPNIPAVRDAVFRWLNSSDPGLSGSSRGAISQHLGPEAGESETPNLDGTARAGVFTDDPGYWELDPPDPGRLEALKEQVEAERLPEFNRLRLL